MFRFKAWREERNYVPEHVKIICHYLWAAEKIERFERIALKMLRELEGDSVGCKELDVPASTGQHLGRKLQKTPVYNLGICKHLEEECRVIPRI